MAQRSGRLGFSLTRTAVSSTLGTPKPATTNNPVACQPRPVSVRSRPAAADRLPRLVVEEWLSGWLTALGMTFSQVNGYPELRLGAPCKTVG
jgi:hypothetical protein